MARISKTDHPKILAMVDVERRKVSDVAEAFGVTPAAMYALLGKLRRAGPAPAADEPALPAVVEEAPAKPAADLFAAVAAPPPAKPVAVAKPPPPAPPTNVRELKQPAAGRGGVGAKAAKPGYGLVMRTGDGEDSMTPFRSLDDLLSAVKPILRAAVRSPQAVWFSIQQVDLSSIELDVA